MKSLAEILKFIKKIDGWLSSHEGYFLFRAAQQAAGRGEIVEIGSWKGKSTICLASGSKKAKVYAIDPHKGEYSGPKGVGKKAPTYREFIQNLKKAEVTEKVEAIVATSENTSKKWKKPIKLLFIDGLHDYIHAKQDFMLWSPFVIENGVIALHDAFCGHEGPKKVVKEDILTSPDYKEIGVVGSIIYAKKGVPNFIESLNLFRSKVFISIALELQKYPFPFKFFLIHRLIKLLLINKYTKQLLFTNS